MATRTAIIAGASKRTVSLSSDIWCAIIELLEFTSWAYLARVNRVLCAIVKKHRLGCKRCGAWLQRFNSSGCDPTQLLFTVNCDFNSGCSMYCRCGAIHDFCGRCLRPSICISHSGCADRLLNNEFAIGTGIAPDTINITGDTYNTCVSRLPTQTERPATTSNTITLTSKKEEEDDDDNDDENVFYVGDLGRRYVIQQEQIGDKIMCFSPNGSDGGIPVAWYCDYCDRHYEVNDK